MRVLRRLVVVAALAAALFALGAGAAYALPGLTGAISGTVTDSVTTGGLGGITVELWSDPGTGMAYSGYSTTTAFGGGYAITGLPAGSYQIRAYDPAKAHYANDPLGVTVADSGVTADVALDPAGFLAGTVQDGSYSALPCAKVYLFSAAAGFGFPYAPEPDPGASIAGAAGDYRFFNVVDPFIPTLLSGDYQLAAFEPAHVAQFYSQQGSPDTANTMTMGMATAATGLDFALGDRSRSPLPARSVVNGADTSVLSNKAWVRRAGDAWAVWYDDAAGGLVLSSSPQRGGSETVLGASVTPYDGAWDVNQTHVFLADGRVIDASTGLVARALDVDGASGAVVSCDDAYVAYLYEIPSSDFLTRTWRLRVFDIVGGFAHKDADLVRPMDEVVRLQPGGTSGGLTAVTSSAMAPTTVPGETPIFAGVDATSSVLAFDYASAAVTTVRELVSVNKGNPCESVIVHGSNVIYVDDDSKLIREVPADGSAGGVSVVDTSGDPTANLSDVTGDGTADFLYALSHPTYTFLGDSAIIYDQGGVEATVEYQYSLGVFSDYDYCSELTASDMGYAVRGQSPDETTHVYTNYVSSIGYSPDVRIDADRFVAADQQVPDVSGENVTWLDWRSHAGPYGAALYFRSGAGPEQVVTSSVYDAVREMGLPRISADWLVYPAPRDLPEEWMLSDIRAWNPKADQNVLVTTVAAPYDADYYYPTLCGLTGDWFVWAAGADRTSSVELRVRNITTGEERLLTTIDTPAPPYTVYFKASAGKVLYVDGAGDTRLYDIASDSTSLVPGLPLQSSFDAFAFDYPRAAYIAPLVENDDYTEFRGTLKTFDFRDGSTGILEQFFVVDIARSGGQPLSLWRNALIAGPHVFNLAGGAEYGFGDALEKPSYASVDATHAVVEAPEGAGAANDIYSLDLSSFVDVTPPVTQVTGVPSGVTTVPVTLQFSATDDMSGVYQMDVGIEPMGTVLGGGTPASVLVDAEGTQTVTYWSEDSWGNREVEHTATVVYDEAPVTTLSVDSGTEGLNGWYRSAVGFHLSATDPGSGVAATWVSIDGAPAVTDGGGGRTLSTDGTHTVEYWSLDGHGTEEVHHVGTLKIDQTPPTVTPSLPGGYVFEGSQTMTITVTDAASGPSFIRVRRDSEPFPQLFPTPPPYTYDMTAPGIYGFYYGGYDLAGNGEFYGDANPVFVSGYAESTPVTQFSFDKGVKPSGWYAEDGIGYLGASDLGAGGEPGCGVANSYYTLDGSTATTYTAVGFPISGDGTHTVTYWSVDAVGHVEPANTAYVPIDTTGPRISSDLKPGYEGAATITFSFADPLSGLREVQTWSGSSWTPWDAPWVIVDTSPGDHSITLQAFDTSDNRSSFTGSYFTGVVSTPETSASVSPAPNLNGWNRLSAPTVTLTATDTAGGLPGSGVKDTFYKIGSVTTTYTGTPIAITAQGATSVEYWSVDRAGNEELPHKSRVVRYDSIDPTVTHNGVAFYEGAGTVTATGHDTNSGPWRTEFKLDTAVGFSSGPDGAPVTFDVGAIGLHSFEYICTDYAGNKSTYGTPPSFSYFVGAVSTPSTVVEGAPTGWSSAPVPLTLTATDMAAGQAGSGVKNVRWRLGTAGSYTIVPGSTAALTVSAAGTTTVQYYATDNVNNAEALQAVTVRVDTTAPTVFDDHLPSYTSTSATVTITAADPESGLLELDYSVDGGTTQTVPAAGAATMSVAVPLTGSGTHALRYVARNMAGLEAGAGYDVQTDRLPTWISIRRGPSTARRYRYLYVTGTLYGGRAGDVVYIEYLRPGSRTWTTAKAGYVSSTGAYRFPMKPKYRGTWYYRVRYYGDATRHPSLSARTWVRVY